MTTRLLFLVWACATCACALLVPPAAADDGATETATYRAAVRVAWTAEAHPADFPRNAHWSRLVAVSHRGAYALFRDGDTASSGLALLAANGRVGVLEAELAEARRRGRVGAHVVVGGVRAGDGAFTFEIEASEALPLVSLATMLAPSPDWFAGASAVSLRDASGWRDRVAAPLFVWDAGADSGATFSAPNADTQPRQSVRLLTHPAFLTASGLKPIGSVTLERVPR